MPKFTIECEIPATIHAIIEAETAEAALTKAKRTFDRQVWFACIKPSSRRTKFKVVTDDAVATAP